MRLLYCGLEDHMALILWCYLTRRIIIEHSFLFCANKSQHCRANRNLAVVFRYLLLTGTIHGSVNEKVIQTLSHWLIYILSIVGDQSLFWEMYEYMPGSLVPNHIMLTFIKFSLWSMTREVMDP
jgi:hypothetical protein